MPHVSEGCGVQQPQCHYLGELRDMTVTYEAGVAVLFGNIVEENINLRRMLLGAGLSPPAPRALRPGWLPTARAPVTPLAPSSQGDDADVDFAEHNMLSMQLQPKPKLSCCALDPLNLRSSNRISGRISGRVSGRVSGRISGRLHEHNPFHDFGREHSPQLSAGGKSDGGSPKSAAKMSDRDFDSAKPSGIDSHVISGYSESDADAPSVPVSPASLKVAQIPSKVTFVERTSSALEGILVSVRDGGSLRSDDCGSPQPKKKGLLKLVVRSFAFESFISVCIIVNCGIVGVWAHQLVTNYLSVSQIDAVEASEHVFVAIFTVELLLKFKALGWRAYKPIDAYGRSNFFDMMLVFFTGIVLIWLIPLATMISGYKEESGAIKILAVLRTFRLARLVRVFQRLPQFREAWLLINGLAGSGRTLFWTVFCVFLVTYVFAIVGVATIVVELQTLLSEATDPADIAKLSALVQMTGGIDKLMALLVQILMTDSFHAFTRQILDYIGWSWIFWYAYIAIANIVLMNLVTAIVVENAIESGKADRDHIVNERERARQKDIDRMRKVFLDMDTDGGGTLSWEEFSKSFEDEELSKTWKVLDIDQKAAWELFQVLDDGEGEITIDDFMEALRRMSGVAQAKDMFMLQKMLGLVVNSLDTMSARDLFLLRQQKAGEEG